MICFFRSMTKMRTPGGKWSKNSKYASRLKEKIKSAVDSENYLLAHKLQAQLRSIPGARGVRESTDRKETRDGAGGSTNLDMSSISKSLDFDVNCENADKARCVNGKCKEPPVSV